MHIWTWLSVNGHAVCVSCNNTKYFWPWCHFDYLQIMQISEVFSINHAYSSMNVIIWSASLVMPLYELLLLVYEKSQVLIVIHGNTCRWVSSKEIHQDELNYWKRNVSLLMCDIQMCFPPRFFNSQEHYLVHLVEKIEQCGPIHIRTMWLVERYMKVLKQFVRKKARLEGSIVEGYMVF